MERTPRDSAPAVRRSAAILGLLAQHQQARRLTDIASELQLPVSSTASLCSALVDERMIRRTTEGYLLGPRVVELAHSFLATIDPLASFGDLVADSPSLCHQTVQLAMLDGAEVLYLARRDADRPFQISSNVGKRLPAQCTAVGKAMLAEMDPSQRPSIEHFEPLTEHSIASPSELAADLNRSRRQGYASDDQETSIGVLCYGVALNPLGPLPVYAISATILKADECDELRDELIAELRRIARALYPQPN